ncbi:MAG: ABC transporter permease [Epsilonproteobacteria bacterium]|nr:ABC transporter permease [Campylobacterota bacterium]
MHIIEIKNLLFMAIPICIVWYFYYSWTKNYKEVGVATLRMVLQLLIIGYLLVYIFNNKNAFVGFFVLLFMISVSSFIALRNVNKKDFKTYIKFFISILIGGSFNLALSLYFVLDIRPLYQPKYIIPLAGMVFANAMNSLSLTAERFEREIEENGYEKARAISLKASLIPQINAFLAVGLVSLPGMMTGQILSGVDPIIAVRYQIMVMAMVLGSAGMSSVIYLYLQKR